MSRRLAQTAALCMGCILTLSACAKQEEPGASKISTQTANTGNLVLGLSADGTVALPVTSLNFEVDGIISKIYVSAGDTVKEGDLLAELDDEDYQLAVTNAQNSVDKAISNYEDTVKQHEYSLLSSEQNLSSLQRQINTAFDDYTYQTSISDAEATLEKRRKELIEAQTEVEDPFDPYTYDNTIRDAEISLQRKMDNLISVSGDNSKVLAAAQAVEDAEKNYNKAVTDRERARKSAVESANKKVTEAQQAVSDAERSYNKSINDRDRASSNAVTSTNNKINEAQSNLSQAQNNYSSAEAAYNETYDPNNDPPFSSTSNGISLANAVSQAQNSLYSAYSSDTYDSYSYDNAVEEARIALERKKADLETAKKDAENPFDSYTYDNTVNDAKTTLERKKADLTNAANDNSSYLSALQSVEDAERSYNKAISDKERAEKSAVDSANKKLADAEQAVTDAEQSLSRARTNLDRARKDYNDNLKSQKESLNLQTISYENSKESTQSITDAYYNIEEAKLRLQEAQNNLAKTKLYASKDGQIISINKSEGEQAAASVGSPESFFGTGSSSSNFMNLCDTSQIYLTANVSEGDIVGLKVDQVVNVTVDSLGDSVFKGKIYKISNIPTTDSNGITTYEVNVLLDELSTDIRDGMNALLNFVKKELNEVLLVPVKSVFVEEEQQYVNVQLADGTYEKRAVVTGLSNGSQTQVLDGLAEGETVVVGKLT